MGKKTVSISSGAFGNSTIINEIPDIDAHVTVNGKGTTAGGAEYLGGNSYRTIAICHRVDGSNYGVALDGGSPPHAVIEIYTDGSGNITVYPSHGADTFADGTSSVVVSSGAIFRQTDKGWAYIKGA